MKRVVGLVLGWCVAVAPVKAETVLDSFDGLSIDIGASGNEETFQASRSTPFGVSTYFQAHVLAARLKAASGKITITGPEGGAGSAGIRYVFKDPVNLQVFDYLLADLVHGSTSHPIDAVTFTLVGGKSIEVRNVSNAPFPLGQKRFPLYAFHSSTSTFLLYPAKVASVDIGFSLVSSAPVVIDKIAFGSVQAKKALEATITMKSDSRFSIAGDRIVGEDELYRLESSTDLMNWAPHSQLLQGNGAIPVFPKTVDQARLFFRLAWFNRVTP